MHTSCHRGRRAAPSARLLLLPLLVIAALGLAACTGRFAPQGWSGVTLAPEGLVVGTADGRVVRYAAEGLRRWEFPRGSGGDLGPLYGSPQIANGLVYVGGWGEGGASAPGKLYALDLESGDVVWKVETEGAIVGSPSVAGDRVLVGDSDGFLYAYDARKGGNPLWTFPREGHLGRVWSQAAVQDGAVYFGALDHQVYAVDLETGAPLWSRPFEADGAIAGKPLVANGRVYVGAFDRWLYALDASTGEQLARVQGGSWFWSGPVSDGSFIFATNLDGKLYLWDGVSDQTAWEFETDGAIVAPPVLVGEDLVAVGSEDGSVYVLQRGSPREVWKYTVGSAIRAPLAVDGEIIYVSATDNTLRALDTGRQRQLWSVDTKQ